ncbi:hypothetical protein H4J45_17665 [Colwellia sp. BRX10-6]|uniref:hypothetical protein n=1 Tax=unclassified Colwellia TaxID=196834 RepID=UPI0015F68340|nr:MULTISPECIES: hypothetical protein [unclassified Colwellia]MBA6383825.1 hypothetical protein [Colwellia sp. BRX10-9]MBA6395912.1 hypothetical protein [Colwellia sp. BRX10-6]
MNKNLNIDNFVLYPLAISIPCFFLTGFTGLKIFTWIALLGVLPLTCILVFGAICLVWEFLDDIFPEFKGKNLLVITLVSIFAILLLMAIFSGDPTSNCGKYRGAELC